MTDEFERTLREELAGAYPSPSDDDVAIALRRVRGRRRRVRRWWPSPLPALAAGVVIALIGGVVVGTFRSSQGDDCMYPQTGKKVAVALSLWLATACADQPSDAVAPAFAIPGRLDMARVQPGTWIYQISRITDQDFESPQGTKTVSLTLAEHGGVPVWQLETLHDMVYAMDTADTLYLSRDGLHLLERRWQWGRWQHGRSSALGGQLVRTFSNDRTAETSEAVEDLSSELTAITRDHLYLILQTLPFALGWEGSVLHRRFEPSVDIMVLADSVITVGAGTFDVWTVQATAKYQGSNWSRRYFYTWWISKDEGWLVKTDSYFSDGFRNEDDVMVMELTGVELGG